MTDTWADAKRVPCERVPLTTHELEVMINTDTRLDLWHEAAQELLERRKADAAALEALVKLGREDESCRRAAHLLMYSEPIAAKVLPSLVEALADGMHRMQALAVQALELNAPSIATVCRAREIAKEEVARAQEAVGHMEKESE
jgi:1,4-dihydroxy-2-naphthoyl-CoA synthase